MSVDPAKAPAPRDESGRGPLVSVILPVHNRAWCLERALDSVQSQTWRPLELVAVDDGSTDESPDILERFREASAAMDLTVQVPRQANRGVSGARNTAIRASRGSLVALLDSDDAWEPEKTERQVEAFRRDPGLMIHQTGEKWIRKGVFVNPPKRLVKAGGDLFARSLDHCAVSPSAVMMRRELLDDTGVFDEAFPACEDYELWLRVTCRYPVGLLPEPLLIKYGGHADQLSATVPALDRWRIRAIVKTLDSGLLNAAQWALAVEALRAKCTVYGAGCRKRGREDEAREILALPGRYAS